MTPITPTKSDNLLSTLQPNSLYILLYWHPKPNIRYHWGLYHHSNTQDGGWKFDIINPGGVWKLAFPYGDGNPGTDVLDPDSQEPLGVAVRVASVEGGEREQVHETIRTEDERLNEISAELEGGMSCRVYVMRACERLKNAGLTAQTVWLEVEKEVLETGNTNETAKGKGVVVVDSKVAVL